MKLSERPVRRPSVPAMLFNLATIVGLAWFIHLEADGQPFQLDDYVWFGQRWLHIALWVGLVAPPFQAIFNLALARLWPAFAVWTHKTLGQQWSSLLRRDSRWPTGLALIVVIPVIEEFVFRLYLQELVLTEALHLPSLVASIVASTLFGAAHWRRRVTGSWMHAIFATGIGLIWGLVFWTSHSIWVTCLLHAINNGTAVIIWLRRLQREPAQAAA